MINNVEQIAEEAHIIERFEELLEICYQQAELISKDENLLDDLKSQLGDSLYNIVVSLGNVKHAFRGAAITLCGYKVLMPNQDIRRHKSEFSEGFSARGIDTKVTVRFLEKKGLPYSVESHWLTQTLSFAGPLEANTVLKTVPKLAGPNLISTVNAVEDANTPEFAKGVVILLLEKMIEERNKGNIPLTHPKNVSIDQVIDLLYKHFSRKYEKNAPRLPQLAIYAIYQCLVSNVGRYENFVLQPLERLKTANRKSGSVGDIDLMRDGRPVEAVEVKFDIPISQQHVAEVIQKIKVEAVERYYVLSTSGVLESDMSEITKLKTDFLKSNGAEIIVNGVYETIKYYLRLLNSTNDFINVYTDLLVDDKDINYEHKVAWNEVCMDL